MLIDWIMVGLIYTYMCHRKAIEDGRALQWSAIRDTIFLLSWSVIGLVFTVWLLYFSLPVVMALLPGFAIFCVCVGGMALLMYGK